MRRALLMALGMVLVVAAFYVAWPAWTAHRVAHAVETNDAAALERRVDFERVRARLRPLVAAEMEQSLDRAAREGRGFGAVIAGQLKGSLGQGLAEAVVDRMVTPGNVILMVRQGKELRRLIEDASALPRSPATGRGAEAPAGNQPPDTQRRRLGLGNIKTYRLTGLSTLAVGVARDAEAREPDLTVEMAFTGGDWQVVGLVPRR